MFSCSVPRKLTALAVFLSSGQMVRDIRELRRIE